MQQGRPSGSVSRAPRWAGVLVAAITLLTFLPAVHNDFVNWDDVDNFLRNPQYRGLGWANVRWMLTTAHGGHYIPVTWLTLGFDYVLWGMDPRGYHLTAVLLHTLNAVLFYLLAYRLLTLGFADRSEQRGPPSADQEQLNDPKAAHPSFGVALGAATAALLFSVHPLRVESVAWITERRDLTAGLFSLLTALTYLSAWRRGTQGRLRTSWYCLSVGLFALALLSKSIVVGLPVVLVALDLYPMRRPPRLKLLIEKVPFVLVGACVSAMMLIKWSRTDLLVDLRTLSVLDRLAILGYNVLFYLQKSVVPWPLSPLYELRIPFHATAATYVISGGVAIAISLLLVMLMRRWPAGLTAWTIYLVFLLPVSGVLQNGHHIAADRNTYLACLSWALLAGAGVTWCVRAIDLRAPTARSARLVVILTATMTIALVALTILQIRIWRDPETLWRHAVAVDPDSAFSHYHLANALSLLGQHPESVAEYGRAVALAPETVDAKGRFLATLGRELQTMGDLDGAERSYNTALRYSANDETALNNLGIIYALRGNDRAALDLFQRALRAAPGNNAACRNIAALSRRSGITAGEAHACSGPSAP